ncbi:uncharacterized protein [Miscanthus floridulus]|uniref:uncharacterized protein n=1 Tax=Miscanthus floridulus TaxID=154761 RepID=UPI00345AB2EE
MAACVASAFRWPQLERLAIYAFPRGVAAAFGAHEISDPEFIDALRLTDSRLASRDPSRQELPDEERRRLRAAIPRPVKAHHRDHAGGQGCLPEELLQRPPTIMPWPRVPAPCVVQLRRRRRGTAVQAGPVAGVEARGARLVGLQLRGRQTRQHAEPGEAGDPQVRSALPYCYIAPRLATQVCRGTVPWIYGSGTARTLRFVELSSLNSRQSQERLESFFQCVPKVEVLELCFRDGWVNRFWVQPTKFPNRFENLKKLLIHLPRMWPLRWIKKLLKNLLEAATCLEKLHIQFFAPSPGTSEEWGSTPSNGSADDLQHNCLTQIVMEGCTWTEGQITLIRHLLSSCGALKTVLLIPHHARQGGVACPLWLMKDRKAVTVSQLRDGIHSNEIIFG